MRPTQFSADTVVALLRKQTVASLTDVMAAFGPRVSRRTAFRKLKDLHARTSYSHRGGYYTLDELADFDEHGLWTFAGVRFSRAGTLVATAEAFVNHAEAGHFVDELDNLLGVGTQDALRKLVGDGRLTRHKLAGHFLYCATDHAHQTHQRRARRLLMATPGLGRPLPDADLMPEELRAAIVLFASLLDERQRRLFAGLESLKCGWGGDRRIATLLGIDPSIASRQAAQILEQLPVDGDIEIGDQVRVGAARDAERLDGDGDARVCSGGPIVVDLLELPASLNGRRRGRLMQRGKLAGALGEILLDARVTIRQRHELSLLDGTDLLEQPTSAAGDPQ